jgi:hypothetical protein
LKRVNARPAKITVADHGTITPSRWSSLRTLLSRTLPASFEAMNSRRS